MLPGRVYAPEDILRIAWRHKWLIVSTISVLTTIVIALSLRLPDLYRAETLILVIPPQVPEAFVRSTVTIRIEDRLRSIRQEILSRERLERIIHDFNLYADQIDKRPLELLVEEMRANADVDTDRDDAFKVTFVAQSPRIAMIVADRLAAMVIEENVRDREGQSMGTNEFLESQLADARKRLESHEKRLEVYRKQYSGELPTQLSSNLQVIQSTQNQIQTLTESINRDRDRRLALEQSMNDTIDSSAGADATPSGAGPTTEAARLQAEIDTARNELQAMRERLTPEHPDIVAKTRALARLEAKARDAADATGAARPINSADQIRRGRARQYQVEIEKLDLQIAGKEAEMQRLRQVMSDYQRRIDAIPGHESELTALMRDYDTLQKVYVDLLGKKEASQISANLERQQVGERFRIIDPARLPEEPISPNRPRFALIAAAAGLLLSLVSIGFLEYRDTSLRTEDEIVRTLTLPVVAAIPLMLAVADVKRQRRNARLVRVFTLLTVCGLSAAIWQMLL